MAFWFELVPLMATWLGEPVDASFCPLMITAPCHNYNQYRQTPGTLHCCALSQHCAIWHHHWGTIRHESAISSHRWPSTQDQDKGEAPDQMFKTGDTTLEKSNHNVFPGQIICPELKKYKVYPFASGKLKPWAAIFHNIYISLPK